MIMGLHNLWLGRYTPNKELTTRGMITDSCVATEHFYICYSRDERVDAQTTLP